MDEVDIEDLTIEQYLEVTQNYAPSVVIIEQRVKVDQKARILEFKRRNYEEHCSDNLYAVSIKEDMTYLCLKLHLGSTKRRPIRRIQNTLYVVSKIKY
ncbi:hypothetical protein Tco_0647085 [Tanacetum coccineum]